MKVSRQRWSLRRFPGRRPAFTLVELLVSMAILLVIITLLAEVIGVAQRTWSDTRADVSRFRESRSGNEAMNRRLSQATLFNYWGYDDPNNPRNYRRQSSLHFVSGPAADLIGSERVHSGHAVFFQAPLGYSGSEAGSLGGGADFDNLEEGLNAWGYFVEFSSDLDRDRPLRPPYLRKDVDRNPERRRFRLMEFRIPSERLELFDPDYRGGKTLGEQGDRAAIYEWFRDESRRLRNSQPIAENVLALVISPQAPGHTLRGIVQRETYIAPRLFFDSREFQWNSGAALAETTRHQLPPVLQLTMIVTDEGSWIRFEDESGKAATNLADFINERFQNSRRLNADLDAVEAELVRLRLAHRRFTFTIPMRAAKWASANQ